MRKVLWAATGRKPTDVTPLLQIDDGRLLNQLAVWAPDAEIRKKILVNNPARLYAFREQRRSVHGRTLTCSQRPWPRLMPEIRFLPIAREEEKVAAAVGVTDPVGMRVL